MSRGKNRQSLIEAGLKLFGERGYAATGVQEVTDAAGVPKGSFYNYFESKEDFAIAVLESYREHAVDHFAILSSDSIASPLARLRAFLSQAALDLEATGFAGGCLAGRLAQELAGEQVRFRAPLFQVFHTMEEGLTRCLTEAQQVGELGADQNPEQLASFLVSAWQGAMLRAKAAGSSRPLTELSEILFGRVLASPQDSPQAV